MTATLLTLPLLALAFCFVRRCAAEYDRMKYQRGNLDVGGER